VSTSLGLGGDGEGKESGRAAGRAGPVLTVEDVLPFFGDFVVRAQGRGERAGLFPPSLACACSRVYYHPKPATAPRLKSMCMPKISRGFLFGVRAICGSCVSMRNALPRSICGLSVGPGGGQVVEDFKDRIVKSLEAYDANIEALRREMDDFAESAK